MVQVNLALKEINCKIVYFGPGLSGKTTNLEIVHQKAPQDSKGELTSIATESDRTLFFDFMPLDLGMVGGMKTKFQLYTVPGQVYYNSTRKLVLRGADGVVFVADSAPDKMEENLESLDNLEECLQEQGRSLADFPHVIQFNKRDLPETVPVEEMNRILNRHGAPTGSAVANKGEGVIDTFKQLSALVLDKVKAMSEKRSSGRPPARAARPVASNAPAAGGGGAAAPSEESSAGRSPSRIMRNAPPMPEAAPAQAPAAAVMAPPSDAPPQQEAITSRRQSAPRQRTAVSDASTTAAPAAPRSTGLAKSSPSTKVGTVSGASGKHRVIVASSNKIKKGGSKGGVSPLVWVALVVLLLGGGAAYYAYTQGLI